MENCAGRMAIRDVLYTKPRYYKENTFEKFVYCNLKLISLLEMKEKYSAAHDMEHFIGVASVVRFGISSGWQTKSDEMIFSNDWGEKNGRARRKTNRFEIFMNVFWCGYNLGILFDVLQLVTK